MIDGVGDRININSMDLPNNITVNIIYCNSVEVHSLFFLLLELPRNL